MENNPIIIEHETNQLYTLYKDVKAKTETAKASYVDLTGKIERLQEIYTSEKIKYDTLVTQISNERLAWATEKAEELKRIEEKKSELTNALKVKADLNKQQEEIRVSTENETKIRNEAREQELKNTNALLLIEERERKVIEAEKVLKSDEKKSAKEIKDAKDEIIKIIEKLK